MPVVMNKKAALRRPAMREETTEHRGRKPFLSPVILASIVGIGAVSFYKVWPGRQHEVPIAKQVSPVAHSDKAARAGESSAGALERSATKDSAQSPAAVMPPARSASAVDRVVTSTNLSPEAVQLVARLSQVDLSRGVLTAE